MRSLAEASQLIKENRLTEAKQIYMEWIIADPTHKEALFAMGNLLYETGFRTAAELAYIELLRHHPAEIAVHIQLGHLYWSKQDFFSAKYHYAYALSQDDHCLAAHKGLSYVWDALGEPDRAHYHRSIGFQQEPVMVLPYRGPRKQEAKHVLLLASSRGGNIPTKFLLDRNIFHTNVLFVEHYQKDRLLPHHDFVFNGIGDADLSKEALQQSLLIIGESLHDKMIVNHPLEVLKTSRAQMNQLLHSIPGVITSRMETVPKETLLDVSFLQKQSYPFLVRSPGFHTGMHFAKIDRIDEAVETISMLPGTEILRMSFIDTQDAQGLYRKYRIMSIGGRLYPSHLAVSRYWKVHYFSSDMEISPHFQQEEAAFLTDMEAVMGQKAVRALENIQLQVNLPYFGIDCTVLADGSLVVFEANPAMMVAAPHPDAQWRYRDESSQALLHAFAQLFR